MINVTAQNLARIIGQVYPHHHWDSDVLPILASIHLDYDGTRLHAVATDRYTFAVARTNTEPPTSKHGNEPWAHTVPANTLKALRKLIKTTDPRALVTITPVTEGDLTDITFTANGTIISTHAIPGEFPSWRKLIASVIDKEPTNHVVGLDSSYADRWEDGGRRLLTWHTGPTQPVVFSADDFIGLQMPVRPQMGEFGVAPIAKEWADSLGNAEPAGMTETLGQPENKPSRDFTEDLLRRVVISGEEMHMALHPDDPRWYDVLNTHIYAWMGVRLLRALSDVSPRLTEKVLRDLDEELEGGEFGEWAWQYAQEAGHDPDKWCDDNAKRRAERAAKKAAEAEAATDAPTTEPTPTQAPAAT
jgi:hypothetical protein